MTRKVYAGAVVTIVASMWATPVEDLLKLFMLAMMLLVFVAVNLIFWFARVREYLVALFIEEILRDPDIQKLIDWEKRRERILKRVKEESPANR